MLCGEYLRNHEKSSQAFYILLLFAVTGMLVVASSAHFASFFLGLETLSVSLYGLIGYTRGQSQSLEAAIKYLIMAAVSSAILLFGIALIYAEAGTMEFAALTAMMSSLGVTAYFGFGLVLVGFGFKLAWAPFHTWSPDVYQGAPAPVTALIASGSKGAVFALLLRFVIAGQLQDQRVVFTVLAVLAVATMFAGNLLALTERNVKRLLAYSSIAQMGYLFIPMISAGSRGLSSAIFYLIAYMAAVIAAFGAITIISADRATGDVEDLADYTGPVNAATVAGGYSGDCDTIADGCAADRRVLRQVLHIQRRGGVRAMVAADRWCREHWHVRVLLSARGVCALLAFRFALCCARTQRPRLSSHCHRAFDRDNRPRWSLPRAVGVVGTDGGARGRFLES